MKDRPEALWALAHHDVPAPADRVRKAPDRIEQRSHVGLGLGGQRVQHGAHAQVRLHERLDFDLARALQHGGVGPYVKLDRVLPGPTRAGG